MDAETLARLRAFLRAAGALKDTLRSGRTPGGRPESAAEHSWRLCLMVMALGDGVDAVRALELAVVHDLGEALGGDVPAPLQDAPADKSARERADLARLLAAAPPAFAARVTVLWEEYEAAATPEARLVKALDKIETMMTHAEGANPPDFDYAFNLGYGRVATDGVPVAAALRALVDEETERRAAGW